MSEELSNPQFWIALALGLVMLGIFIYWLSTGAREKR